MDIPPSPSAHFFFFSERRGLLIITTCPLFLFLAEKHPSNNLPLLSAHPFLFPLMSVTDHHLLPLHCCSLDDQHAPAQPSAPMFLFFTEIKPWQALTLPTSSLSLDPEVIFTFLLRSAAHHLCFPFRPKILSWPLTLPSCLSSSTSRLSALTSCSWQSLSRLVKPSTTQSPSLGRSRASARHPCSSKLAV